MVALYTGEIRLVSIQLWYAAPGRTRDPDDGRQRRGRAYTPPLALSRVALQVRRDTSRCAKQRASYAVMQRSRSFQLVAAQPIISRHIARYHFFGSTAVVWSQQRSGQQRKKTEKKKTNQKILILTTSFWRLRHYFVITTGPLRWSCVCDIKHTESCL